jgi:hypothetical protein
VVRWAVVTVPLDDAANIGDVKDRIRDALELVVAKEADGRLLACRLVLTGRTELHPRLVISEQEILVEARASALGLGDEVAWIERVVIDTRPTIDPQMLAQRKDAIGELQRMLQEAGADQALLAQIEGDIGELVRRLPHEIRTDVEDQTLKMAMKGDYAALVAEVAPYLSARLAAQED